MEPGGSPPPVPAAAGTGWILVCDDTASIRLLMRINLELEGFEVLEAVDGRAALDLLGRNRDRLPAAVILDAQMSPLDGWGAVAAIREDPALTHVPIVMVTASLQQQERERSVAAGVDAFVAKPFEPQDLVDLVSKLARSGRAPAQP
jgi:CheY-like chemotaxis protein